ncbi:hypothetical protein WJX82_006617 [Trebouxia sp. C0006]
MQGAGRAPSASPAMKTDRGNPVLRLPIPPSDAVQGTSRSGLPQPPSASALRLPPTGAALSPPIASSSLPLPPSAATLQLPPSAATLQPPPSAGVLALPPGNGLHAQNAELTNLKKLLANKEFQCQQLDGKCKQQEQGFANKVQEMLKQTDEHAAQYFKDRDWRDKKIDNLKEQLQDSGKHGYKRPRDHSNGRDSKRRT